MNYVYIVLINYNGWEHTVECVDSIFRNSYQNFKIVIVDNNSNAWLKIEQKFCNDFSKNMKIIFAEKGSLTDYNANDKQILLIKNNSNDGFAAGCNCAFNYIRKQDDYKYVWLLGSDNVIEKNALNNLIEYMEKANDVALCGSVSLSYYQRHIIQCAGVGIYNKWTSSSKHLLVGKNVNTLNSFDYKKALKNKIAYVYGNSMFFRKEFFINMPQIPENYFIYYEELEIMQQLKNLNMKFGIALDSFIYHKEGSSTGGKAKSKSLIADYYGVRNRILVTKKYYKYCLPTVYFGLILAIVNRIRRKQFTRIPLILKLMLNPYPKFNEVKP